MAFLGALVIAKEDELIPAGEYNAIIRSCDLVPSKNNPDNYNIKIVWELEEGRREFIEHVVYRHHKIKAVEIGHSKLRTILRLNGLDPDDQKLDTNNFINLEAKLIIEIKPANESMSKDHNNIINYMSATNNITSAINTAPDTRIQNMQNVGDEGQAQVQATEQVLQKAPWARG